MLIYSIQRHLNAFALPHAWFQTYSQILSDGKSSFSILKIFILKVKKLPRVQLWNTCWLSFVRASKQIFGEKITIHFINMQSQAQLADMILEWYKKSKHSISFSFAWHLLIWKRVNLFNLSDSWTESFICLFVCFYHVFFFSFESN